MIEELVDDDESQLGNKRSGDHYIPEDTFTRPSYMIGCPESNQRQQTDGRVEGDTRLPWIHKSDPLDFHPSNVLPSVNHVELPLR